VQFVELVGEEPNYTCRKQAMGKQMKAQQWILPEVSAFRLCK
jgi:hypothetical protein